MSEIRPIAMPGTHQKFLEFFLKKSEPKEQNILDLGAGHGAFSQKLFNLGYNVSACDLFPEIFEFTEITCQKADITKTLPYPDNTFDIIIAIEVIEHISDHEMFFSEASRILKPDGKLYVTTPNILSLKSRVRFLFSGFFYSFNKLELSNYDGLQHVSSLTVDQYNYIAIKNHFKAAIVNIDKQQSTSKIIHFFLYPFIMLYPGFKKVDNNNNNKKLLLGRLLIMVFGNNK